MYRPPSRFLVRPIRFEGESLSSWRQRTAWANGFRLFPVPDGHLRRSDPDMGLNDLDLEWIAALHDTSNACCREMTLAGQVGRVIDHVSSRSQPRWWLRCRYGETGPHHGSMYCPKCLAEDERPYFRLSWRFAFNTACDRHGVLLADRCPQCGRPPWPSACGVGDRINPHFASLAHCPYCDASLTDTPQSCPVSPARDDRASDNLSVVSGSFGANTIESLAALRSICHLFIRVRPRRAILASRSRWAVVANAASTACLQQNAIEHAPVEDRHLLVTAGLEICSKWPASFIAFAHDAGISRTHFNGSTSIQPPWMNTVIDDHLALQNRFITEELMRTTFNQLESSLGRRPYKYELRQALNWRGEKGLEKLYDC